MYVIRYYLNAEGSDFTPVSEVLLFTAEVEECIDVLVNNDDVLEETEFFFLELNTTDPRAFTFSPRATINILDNDSKFHDLCSTLLAIIVVQELHMR